MSIEATSSASSGEANQEAVADVPSPQQMITQDGLDQIREELSDALDAEAETVDKQISLLQEKRDLKVALEDAEMEVHLSKLRAERDKLEATKRMNQL